MNSLCGLTKIKLKLINTTHTFLSTIISILKEKKDTNKTSNYRLEVHEIRYTEFFYKYKLREKLCNRDG